MTTGVNSKIDQIQVGALIAKPSLTGSNYYSFDVPLYQRKYSWESKQWNNFFDDLLEHVENESENWFLGTIITYYRGVSSGEQRHDLIDGQQRITTIFIFYTALINCLVNMRTELAKSAEYAELNEQVGDLIKELKIICNPRRLKHANDRRGNTGNFSTYYEQIYAIKIEKQVSTTRIPKSQYIKAYDFFVKRIKDLLSNPDKPMTDIEKIGLLQSINMTLGRAELIWAQVNSLSYAIKIFDSLNSRGKPLGVTDLIKLYYFEHGFPKIQTPEQKNDLLLRIDQFWNELYDLIGQTDDATTLMTRFMRQECIIFLESKVTEKQLPDKFKDRFVKNASTSDKNEFYYKSFEDHMRNNASIYGLILNPDTYTMPVNIDLPSLGHFIQRRGNNTNKEYIVSQLIFDMNELELVQIHLLNLYLLNVFFEIPLTPVSGYNAALQLLHIIESKLLRFVIRRNLTNQPPPNVMEAEVPKIITNCQMHSSIDRMIQFDKEVQKLLDLSRDTYEDKLSEIAYDDDVTEVRLILHMLEKWKIDGAGNLTFRSEQIFNAFATNHKGSVKWQIEHVLPQAMLKNPPTVWSSDLQNWGSQFSTLEKEEKETLVHSLGNLTLVEHNSALGTSSLANKQTYKASGNGQVIGFKTTLVQVLNSLQFTGANAGEVYSLANTPMWTEHEIRSRQAVMVEEIKKLLN